MTDFYCANCQDADILCADCVGQFRFGIVVSALDDRGRAHLDDLFDTAIRPHQDFLLIRFFRTAVDAKNAVASAVADIAVAGGEIEWFE